MGSGGFQLGVDHSVVMRANRKFRRKDLSRRKIPRFNLRLNAPSGFPLKIASIKAEAVLGKRGNAGFSGKSRTASVEIESTINPTGLRSGDFNRGGSLRNDARQSQVPMQRSVETENSAFQPEALPAL